MIKAFERKYKDFMKNTTPREYDQIKKASKELKMKEKEVIMMNCISLSFSDMSKEEVLEMREAVNKGYAKIIRLKYKDLYVPTKKYLKTI